MSEKEWERITKLRCPRKPPAHLDVYYEQNDERGKLSETREGKKGDESTTGTSKISLVSLDKEWSSMRNMHPDVSMEQTLAHLTATDASPITSRPSNISNPHPHIDLPESSIVLEEIIPEIETGDERKVSEKAGIRRGMLYEIGEGLIEIGKRPTDGKKNQEEVPLKIIKYRLSHDNRKDS